jgi:hypothetical protein
MLTNLFNNFNKKLAALIEVQYKFIVTSNSKKSEIEILEEITSFKKIQQEIELVSAELNAMDRVHLDFLHVDCKPQIFVALKALEYWGDYTYEDKKLTNAIAIDLLGKADRVCYQLLKDFPNFVKLFEKLDEFKFLYANDKGIHYRIDLGYDYNPLANKDLHEGYIYCSLNMNEHFNFTLKTYKVKKFAMVDKVNHGEPVTVIPNMSVDYYEASLKKSFKVMMDNIDGDISVVYEKKK